MPLAPGSVIEVVLTTAAGDTVRAGVPAFLPCRNRVRCPRRRALVRAAPNAACTNISWCQLAAALIRLPLSEHTQPKTDPALTPSLCTINSQIRTFADKEGAFSLKGVPTPGAHVISPYNTRFVFPEVCHV